MTRDPYKRGGASVGLISDLSDIEAASVLYFRMWFDGPTTQAQVTSDIKAILGQAHGKAALRSFEQLCNLFSRYGRRPLMRHSVMCKCLGSDESCFANFIATATDGDHEDAMLIATLFVRGDMAPLIASLAADFGLALKKMRLGVSHDMRATDARPTLH